MWFIIYFYSHLIPFHFRWRLSKTALLPSVRAAPCCQQELQKDEVELLRASSFSSTHTIFAFSAKIASQRMSYLCFIYCAIVFCKKNEYRSNLYWISWHTFYVIHFSSFFDILDSIPTLLDIHSWTLEKNSTVFNFVIPAIITFR